MSLKAAYTRRLPFSYSLVLRGVRWLLMRTLMFPERRFLVFISRSHMM